MRRLLLALFVVLGPVLMLTASGCDSEVRTRSESQRTRENGHRMVPPGDPTLE